MTHQSEWRQVPEDPDPTADLGYEMVDLDVFPTSIEDDSRMIVLPNDEEFLHEDEFILVDESTVRDLDAMI